MECASSRLKKTNDDSFLFSFNIDSSNAIKLAQVISLLNGFFNSYINLQQFCEMLIETTQLPLGFFQL